MANSIHIGGGGGGSTPTLITKSITQNGTYLAQDDNADGYSSVEVDVAGGAFTPVSFDNETHIIETRRTITITENEIISPVSSSTSCTGIVTIPVSNFTKDEFIVEYDIGTPSYSSGSGYYARVFFSDTIPTNAWTAEGAYGHIPLSQSTTARTGLMQRVVSIPTEAQYFNIELGVTNFASLKLWEEVGGGTVVQNLKLNEGKIALTTGEIVADSDYYYTDYFDMPSGYIMFDMNLSSNQTYDGLVIYDDSGNYNNYWNPNARFRVVNMASYYHEGYKCRLSFRKSNIDYVMLRDYNANILYTTNTPVVIGDEHYQWGSNGLQLHNLLTAGVVSNDYDYATATFADSIGTNDNYLLMRMLKDGTYRYMYLSKSDIPASGEYSFAFSDVQCAISQTTIRATYYSGNWRYIYVDIVGSSDLIFPQAE